MCCAGKKPAVLRGLLAAGVMLTGRGQSRIFILIYTGHKGGVTSLAAGDNIRECFETGDNSRSITNYCIDITVCKIYYKDNRFGKRINSNNIQFGFVPGWCTTDSLLLVRPKLMRMMMTLVMTTLIMMR